MGMFDHVKFSMKCPFCGQILKGFQSKSAKCCLDKLNFWEGIIFMSIVISAKLYLILI